MKVSSSPQGSALIRKGPLDAKLTEEIAGYRRELGLTLFGDVLSRVAGVEDPRDIPNQKLQQHPDEFLSNHLNLAQGLFCSCV